MFKPNPGAQTAFWESLKLEQWLIGGNRSGKTESTVAKAMALLQDKHPYQRLAPRRGGWRVWVSTQNHMVQRDTIQDKIAKYMPASWIAKKYESRGIWQMIKLEHPDDPKHPVNGTTIGFKTYDGGVQTYESASIDLIINDEEPPEDIYEAEQARVLDRRAVGNGLILTAMTPTEGITWTYERIVVKPPEDTFYAAISTYENIYIPKREIEKLEAKLSPWQRKARIYGTHTSREGMVLDKFRPYVMPHGNIMPQAVFEQAYCTNGKLDFSICTAYESIDYGYRYPTAVGFYVVGEDGVIIKYDEIYIAGWTVEKIKAAMYLKRQQWGYEAPFLVFIDPSTRRSESDGTTVYDQYCDPTANVFIPDDFESIYDIDQESQKGKLVSMSVPAVLANNARDEGWELMNKRFMFDERGVATLYFTDNCHNSIREARLLAWAPEAKGTNRAAQKETSRKKDDHTCDEGRYLVMGQPFFEPTYTGKLVLDDPDTGHEDYHDSTTGY